MNEEVEQDYAPGLPKKKFFGGDISVLDKYPTISYFLQQHATARKPNRPHLDLRIGTPETQLFSWAIPKGRLPTLREKLLAVNTELHRFGYGSYEGKIGPGYGHGNVKVMDKGSVIINKINPRSITFTLAHAKVPSRYKLMKLNDNNWLMTNRTPTVDDITIDKPKFTLISKEELPNFVEKAKQIQEKIDGAYSTYNINESGDIDAFSPRLRTTGEPIVYTEKLKLNKVKAPDIGDTVLRGEVFGEKMAQVLPFSETSGLLLSNTDKSLLAQKQKRVMLRNALFDVIKYKGEDVSSRPYEERYGILKNLITSLPKEQFILPRQATTPEEKQQLIDDIMAYRNARTNEGVIIDNKYKFKLRPETTAYMTGVFEGTGKRKNSIGGITFTDVVKDIKNIGKVGTGFKDTDLNAIAKNIEEYKGRPFKLEYQEKLPSGMYRAPSFKGWETDKENIKVAKDITGGHTVPIKIVGKNGRDKTNTIYVEIASTAEQKMKGLSNRSHIANNSGMLFTEPSSFWMKDVKFDLDLVYVKKDGTIVDIIQMKKHIGGGALSSYNTTKQSDYAIELPGNFCQNNGVNIGDTVEVDT